jgi:hypothetical protein
MFTQEPERYKMLSELNELRNFTQYAVDVNGNVYSFKGRKIRKLKPGWVNNKNGHLFVCLWDDQGNKKNLYIHRLVAMMFIPRSDESVEVIHKNGNIQDNRVENLEWINKSHNRKRKNEDIAQLLIKSELLEKVKTVHALSARKGIKVSDTETFANKILSDALDSYMNQYGLRRLMIN